ncbi:hypothetical protein AN478_06470 [Thiohalorhabdus denitrificans]|uniref:FimV/HubP family polar landmark protein n=1 Tax=Thiohalorhabdus denitrificans TaxID=381306 RepID=UPI0006D59747|nr:FimV/HubP family polar landmark protein [Thiohalorhabdus denitrificans]KPV40433.1 hypothetical protein AN478_06470 [Thiohalorhabdus denitrificans]
MAGLFLGLVAVSETAVGLGLGKLEVESRLGSPLHAEAPVHLSGQESATSLEVALASAEDYRMVGQTPAPIVRQLEVRLLGGEPPRIVLLSSEPLHAPLFEVMVRIGDGDNQVLKMFTVALDPARAAPPEAKASASQSAGSGSSGGAGTKPRPATASAAREVSAPRGGEPAVERPAVEVTEGWAKRDRYGPVRPGDTLATVVQRVRQDASVPMESALVAVWKDNPEAFVDGNMNLLRRGAVLDLPGEERIRRISVEEAESLIAEQRREWEERGQPGADPNPGHERYHLKVGLDRDDNGAPTASTEPDSSESGDDPEEEKKPEEGKGEEEPEQAEPPEKGEDSEGPAKGEDPEQAESPGEAEDPSESEPVAGDSRDGGSLQEAAVEAGKDIAGEGAAGEQPGLAVAEEVQADLEELRGSLEDRRSSMQTTIGSLEDRLTSLNERLDQQSALIDKQSETMSAMATRPADDGGMPSRDRYTLWGLAGVNLLMLLAILALWRKVSGGPRGTPPPSGDGGLDGSDGAMEDLDPLTRANAQAAAGELKQARSTLWQALALEPQNWALYGRLLDLYEEEWDGDQFEEVARRLFSQLGDSHPDWQEEIRWRGRQLKPESTLFAGLGHSTPVAGSEAGGAAKGDEGPSFDMDDFDLGLSSEAGAANESAPPSPAPTTEPESGGNAAAAMGEPEPEDDLVFSFGDEPQAEEEPVPAPDKGTTGVASAEAAGTSLEEDLSLSLDGDATEPSSASNGHESGTGEAGEHADLALNMDTGGGSDELTADLSGASAPVDSSEPTPSRVGSGAADDGGNELEFDLGLDAGSEDSGSAGEEDLEWAAPEGSTGNGPEVADDGLEFDLGSLEEEGPAPSPSAPEATAPNDGADDLDLSLSDLSGEGPSGGAQDESWLDLDASGGNEAGGSGPVPGEGGEPDDNELDIKLDLARAWIDMGDPESARGLLQEVESQGETEQQERARQLLASLS